MGYLQDAYNRTYSGGLLPTISKQLAMSHLFKVSISGYYQANFIGVDGLSAELQTYEYREGGENSAPHLLPDVMKWNPVTFTKGEVRNDSDLWHWFRTYFQLEGSGGLGKPRWTRNVKIVAIDNDGHSIMIYTLYKAFIQTINMGAFDSMNSAYRVTSITLQHHGMNAEFPLPEGGGKIGKASKFINRGL